MNSESMNQLVNAGEDEDDFNQLNNETFGELSNSLGDWENDHEKLAESEIINPDSLNFGKSSSDSDDGLQEPLHFLKYPPIDLNSLRTPSSFLPTPNLAKFSIVDHLLEDEAELAIHESDLVRQLSRLVAENEEEEERFNQARQHHPLTTDVPWVVHNGLQPPDPSTLFSPTEHKNHTPRNLPRDLTTPCTPLPPSGLKSKMTLEELEAFLINDDKRKRRPSGEEAIHTSASTQQSPFPPPPPLTPSFSSTPQRQQSQQNIQLTQHQQQVQECLNNQRISLQQQQQQLLLQLQQAQRQAMHVQQRLVSGNIPPLNSSQLQQQIILRQQQQQLFKLQHFLQHNLQQIQQQNLVLQQQYRHFFQQQQQQQIATSKAEPSQKANQAVTTSFPQHQQQNFQQQQMMMMMRQPLMFPFVPAVHHLPPHMQPHPPPHLQAGNPLQSYRPRPPDDPFYNGLMEQREKDWLVKIQLLQLHTDNPLIDDYYFTCWSMKKLMKENKKLKKNFDKSRKEEEERKVNEEDGEKEAAEGDAEGKSSDDDEDDEDGGRVAQLLISTDDHDASRQYVPVQFEGSLGKLRATSIYNPRRVLDVHVPVNVEDAKKQDEKKLKEVLYKIEKGFDLLLQADELHNRICKVDLDMRDNLEIKRLELLERLTTELLGNQCHVLQQVLAIRKGVVMVTRWMPLLSKDEEQHEVLKKLMSKLPALVKKDWCDEISHRLFKAMAVCMERTASVQRLLEYCSSVNKACKSHNVNKYLSSLLSSQLSFSCMHMLVCRMEALVSGGGGDEVLAGLHQWREFIEGLGGCMAKVEGHLSPLKPHHHHTDAAFRSHLGRFLNESVVTAACASLQPPQGKLKPS